MTTTSGASRSRNRVILTAVIALLGLCLCGCSILNLLATVFKVEGVYGSFTNEQGLVMTATCGIPALLLLLLAGVVWVLTGRTKSTTGTGS